MTIGGSIRSTPGVGGKRTTTTVLCVDSDNTDKSGIGFFPLVSAQSRPITLSGMFEHFLFSTSNLQ